MVQVGRMVAMLALAVVAVGCVGRGGVSFESRVRWTEVERSYDAGQAGQADVLLPGVPLPAPRGEREMPEEDSGEGDASKERPSEDGQEKGARERTLPADEVDTRGEVKVRAGYARLTERTRVWVSSGKKARERRDRTTSSAWTGRVTPSIPTKPTCSPDSIEEKQKRRALLGLTIEAYEARLGRKWSYFVTLTFSRPQTTADTAASSLRSFLSGLGKAKPESVLWVVELQRRGTAHIHALWASGPATFKGRCEGCPGALHPHPCPRWEDGSFTPEWRCLNEAWARKHGWARFKKHNGSFGASQYIGKYIHKGDNPEWGYWQKGVDY